jgi:hypothetical protein
MRLWLIVISLLLGGILVAAVIGIQYEDTIEDIPVPADGTGCAISEEVLPKPPFGSIIPVEVDMDWDDESIWLGIISGQERDRLIAASTLDSDVVVECDPETIEFLAGGPNAQSETAFTWEMHEDDRYAITGQSGLLDENTDGVLDGVIGDDENEPLVTFFDLSVNAHAAAGPTLLVGLGILEALTIIAGFMKATKSEGN